MRKIFLALFILLVVVAAGVTVVLYNQVLTAHTPAKPVTITIEPGTSLQQVAKQLETLDVIKTSLSLRLLARINEQAGQIQAGTYRFADTATPEQIFSRLLQGDVEKVSLTIPEGFTMKQIIARIAADGHGDADKLQQLATDHDFIQSLGIEADSLEGYLFPETYLFAEGIGEKALLKMMVEHCFQQLDEELLADAKKLNLNRHQLVTLASIIEKETGVVEEMPLISSVFHNRLQRGIPLQTDPTVIYGIKDFDGNIKRKHLTTPTPYNTYLIKGLPPGPIASPGKAALYAAAHPASTKYLYFVARGDGSHQFSKTLQDHNAAVRKYQLRRK